ncbi:MAG TPA: OmpH family outer membrane protein [Steroidobacteraceae bacterium]|nr:OmpH family outer membrane protein [Steroidobacteraceae bacterium]HRX89160.1 OmpH family outer membrane protein [Steroidobacteraceae bacterium]
MKRSIQLTMWGIAATASLALAAMPTVAQQVKVGVVDYGRLMEESPQAKAVADAIRAEFSPKNAQLQQEQAALKAREEKLQKDAATMTAEQRSKAEKDLRDGVRELARKQSEAQDDFNARRQEEMTRLQRTLIEEVRTYAKAQNYDVVIAEGVIYATPAVDITPAILTALQARPARPTAATAPAAAKPPAKP